jgi:hypothetical protein
MESLSANPPDLSACGDLQQQLDDALADTFPASDPVSISVAEECWDGRPADPANRADQGERDDAGVKRPAS